MIFSPFYLKDYNPSNPDDYARLVVGVNRFRILSGVIAGWEHWEDKKVWRYRFKDKPAALPNPDDEGSPLQPKLFFAMVVWNYAKERLQVLNITQARIRKGLETLWKDADWGNPIGYDIKIVRSGEGKSSEYAVTSSSKTPADPRILEEFEKNPCCLEELFEGEHPFHPTGMFEPTPLLEDAEFEKSEAVVATHAKAKRNAPTSDKKILHKAIEALGESPLQLDAFLEEQAQLRETDVDHIMQIACIAEVAPGYAKQYVTWLKNRP